MAKARQTYGEAIVAARAMVNAARLADPGEHFPYKHEEVTSLIEENPPMGPRGPDDDSFLAEDYTSRAIADATQAYVVAQAAYLADPGAGTKAAYESTRDDLVAARLDHRANRNQSGFVARARRAGESWQ